MNSFFAVNVSCVFFVNLSLSLIHESQIWLMWSFLGRKEKENTTKWNSVCICICSEHVVSILNHVFAYMNVHVSLIMRMWNITQCWILWESKGLDDSDVLYPSQLGGLETVFEVPVCEKRDSGTSICTQLTTINPCSCTGLHRVLFR